MAYWINWTEKQKEMWKDWVAERSQVIQDMIKKYDFYPPKLYLLKPTGHKVTLHSFHEGGTLSVYISQKFNPLTVISVAERNVFNIKPDDLEECDLDGKVKDGSICENEQD